MKKPALPVPIRIIDAIRTSNDGNFYLVEGSSGSHWFALSELISGESQIRDRINKHTGAVLVTADAIRSFQELVERHTPIREGVVASHPGWAGASFVCGDRAILTAPGKASGVDIVTFSETTKFAPRGTLTDWQECMTPFVRGHVLPFFAVSLALSGPLLRFLPAEVMNPQVELVGPAKNGKSTLGTLAASVWAGNPNKTEAGGENWDLTANAYGQLRLAHRDMAMVLDEAEGSGANGSGRAALAKSLVFAGATTSSRRRFNESQDVPELRIPVLSTSNTPLWEVLRGTQDDARQAAMSRMFSIRVARRVREGGLRIFSRRPAGFGKMSEAARALRNAVNIVYGTAGPAFAQVIVDQLATDPIGFQRDTVARFTAIRGRLYRLAPRQDERHLDMMAAIELTAVQAQAGGVLPTEWGAPHQIIETVLGSLYTPETERLVALRTTWAAFGRQLHGLRDREKIGILGLIPYPNQFAGCEAILRRPTGGSCELLYKPQAF